MDSNVSDSAVVCFEVRIDGNPIGTPPIVYAITLDTDASGQQKLRLEVLGGDDSAQELLNQLTQWLPQTDANRKIELLLGYNQSLTCVFSGEIEAYRFSREAASGEMLSIAAHGRTACPETNDVASQLHFGDNVFTFEVFGPVRGGSATVQGQASIWPGRMTKLAGFPTPLDGDYRIARVVHDVRDGNWLTDLHFGGGDSGERDKSFQS